jgi:hypothetical protein
MVNKFFWGPAFFVKHRRAFFSVYPVSTARAGASRKGNARPLLPTEARAYRTKPTLNTSPIYENLTSSPTSPKPGMAWPANTRTGSPRC